MSRRLVNVAGLLLLVLGLSACSGGGGSSAPAPTYSINVSVSGLAGSGLVLQNNGGDDLAITADGDYSFSGKLRKNAAYDITVLTQPATPNQTCTVTGGSGTVSGADVSGIAVSCVTNAYTINGSVSGLAAGNSVVLQNNSADDLTVDADGSFVFSTAITDGTGYNVTVLTQPTAPNQTCTVTGGSGTVSGADVSGIAVSCVTNAYTINGSVSGLAAGNSVVLRNNGGDDLTVSANGGFAFSTALTDGAGYAVTVLTNPTTPNQTCTVTGGSGTLAGANVTGIVVNCVTNTYTVGVTVSGLAAGNSVVLQNNAIDNLTVSGNGNATFSTAITDGTGYNVTVLTQPTTPSQTCTVTGGSGTLAGANVTGIAVNCVTNTYTVGVTVSGLASGNNVVLQNNGGNNLTATGNASFTFSTALNDESTYAVTVLTQPTTPNQTCTVTGGSGTLAGANVSGIAVNCVTVTYNIGGSITNLTGTGLILQNGAVTQPIPAGSGSYSFSVPDGGGYNISVSTDPSGQACSVTGSGMGIVNGADVNTVNIQCANLYNVSVNVSGLTGMGLALANNYSDMLVVDSNGTHVFSMPLPDGGTYYVLAQAHPAGEYCAIASPSGTISGADVAINVSCGTGYTLNGTVNGLAFNNWIELQNGPDTATVVEGAGDTFSISAANGSGYDVTVVNQPATQTCTVSNGTGTVSGADVNGITVDCPRAWGTAMLLEMDNIPAVNPRVAFSSDGTAIAVWKQDRTVMASRYTAATGWGAPVTLQPFSNALLDFPNVAMDGSGNAIAIWPMNYAGIVARHYDATGGTWGAARLVNTLTGSFSDRPQIALDAAGNAMVLSSGYVPAQFSYMVHATRYDATSDAWGPATLIESGNTATAFSAIAFNGDGDAFAVWSQGSNNREIRANRYDAVLGVWSAAGTIGNSGTTNSEPKIAMDTSGNILAVWHAWDAANSYHVRANRYDATSGLWATQERIDATGNTGFYPDVAVDASGNAMVVWQQNNAEVGFTAYNATDGTWGTASTFATAIGGNIRHPRIVIDGSGNAMAVWQDGGVDTRARFYDQGTDTWGTATTIENINGSLGGSLMSGWEPQVGVGADGSITAIWGQSDGGVQSIFINRY